jgi:hypothetical protein
LTCPGNRRRADASDGSACCYELGILTFSRLVYPSGNADKTSRFISAGKSRHWKETRLYSLFLTASQLDMSIVPLALFAMVSVVVAPVAGDALIKRYRDRGGYRFDSSREQ